MSEIILHFKHTFTLHPQSNSRRVFLPSYPPRHSGVDPLFELRVCGEAVPHDVRGVVFIPQLRAALKQEVYDEEFDAAIQAWNR